MERRSGSFSRGDVVWLEFSSQGHEQRGRRPAIVLSPAEYNEKSGLMLVCPVTSKAKGYPFEVVLKGKVKGVVLTDQIRSVDWQERKAQYIESAPDTVERMKELLGLLLP